MKIWKYPVEKKPNEYGDVELEMPKGAIILTIQVQKPFGGFMGVLEPDKPCIWAAVEPDAETEIRRFRIIGTGHEMAAGIYLYGSQAVPNGYLENDLVFRYIGTFQEGPFAWHLFERGPK